MIRRLIEAYYAIKMIKRRLRYMEAQTAQKNAMAGYYSSYGRWNTARREKLEREQWNFNPQTGEPLSPRP